MKILFATPECAPFVKTGGLGDVSQALPKALARAGAEVSVVLPYYQCIRGSYGGRLEFVTCFSVPLSWRQLYCGIFRCVEDGVTYYFIDNEYYFLRGSVYGDYDDGERYAYFCKAVLEMLRPLGYFPDVIHANDWQCSMIPLFLRVFYQSIPEYSGIKTMFTIHNIEYQGKVSYSFLQEVLGMGGGCLRFLDFGGCLNLMFSAVVLADKLTTVSESYAEEVKDPYYGCGLHEVLRGVSYKFCGIGNGIDTERYDPRRDPYLSARFGGNWDGWKREGKRSLQEELGLARDEGTAVLAMVTRLAAHKGLDLVGCVLDEIMKRRVQVVVLGTGEWAFEQMLREAAGRWPGRLSVNLRFDSGLASRIYAASELFLMPSKAEPCGLAQMIAMRYGALPVVRATGGLKDTVWPINPQTGEGRGFTFQSNNAHDMLDAVDRSLALFYDQRDMFRAVAERNMNEDFGWGDSAGRYLAIYESM